MATTLAFGKCEACGENNNMQSQVCRKCGKPLPWSKPAKSPAGGKPPKMKVVGPKTPVISSDTTARWGFGLLIFFICLSIGPVGAFILHRVLSSSENELAGFAEAGMYLVVVLWALAFVGVMATSVNKTGP